jgi:solute carrier family 35 protein E3
MPSKLAVSVGLGLNLASAIGIVMINKLIYMQYQFPSMCLTLVHFVMTFLCLRVCIMLNIFSPKSLPVYKVLPLAASFCGFVVFTNLSLQFNTVGTYQLCKALTTPMILFLQAVIYDKQSSLPTKLTVVCMHVSATLFVVWCGNSGHKD